MTVDNNDLERLVNNWLKPMSEKLDYITGNQEKAIIKNAENIQRNGDTIGYVKETVIDVSNKVDNHIVATDKKESRAQFSISQWVAVALVLLAIIGQKYI